MYFIYSNIKVPAGANWDSNNTKRLKLALKYRGIEALV